MVEKSLAAREARARRRLKKLNHYLQKSKARPVYGEEPDDTYCVRRNISNTVVLSADYYGVVTIEEVEEFIAEREKRSVSRSAQR